MGLVHPRARLYWVGYIESAVFIHISSDNHKTLFVPAPASCFYYAETGMLMCRVESSEKIYVLIHLNSFFLDIMIMIHS